MFIMAANTKNELAVPVCSAMPGMVTLATKNGKATALTAAPMLPTIFMAADTAPEREPPMSMQNAQLGLSVISTPKVAREKQAMNTQTELASAVCVHSSRPRAPSEYPIIAGRRRDIT